VRCGHADFGGGGFINRASLREDYLIQVQRDFLSLAG
jgi:hypothetical protein